ncbi:MAG: ECF-type sigma factor [Planctomycetota bacterium]
MTEKEFDALIQAAGQGDRDALNAAWPELYDHLHEIASGQMSKERSGRHLLQTTAIVHEAYFRLSEQKRSQWRDRNSFFAAASVVMRRILIDSARNATAAKRGGSMARQTLSDTRLALDDNGFAAVEIHEALERLAAFAPDQSKALELMIFGGMTGEEVADVLGVSASTIDRRVRAAKAWLRRELNEQ